MKSIDFWFSVGSTYTYLTVMRLKSVAQETGLTFNWRPFSVRAIMQDMNNVPFIGKPAKERYMWRDLARRASMYGIPINLPVEYPLAEFDLVNRVAIVAQQEGWCDEFVICSYRLWFQGGPAAGSRANLESCIERAGHESGRILALAAQGATQDSYEAATSEARDVGIFGSPSFVVDESEIFWGDDRLEDAIKFSRNAGKNA